jgi:hypothetical protein
MVAYVEIAVCLVAVAGSAVWSASEFTRIRKDRQIQQALRLAIGQLV